MKVYKLIFKKQLAIFTSIDKAIAYVEAMNENANGTTPVEHYTYDVYRFFRNGKEVTFNIREEELDPVWGT